MKTGMKLVTCREATGRLGCFEDKYALPASSQVGCAHQAIVAGANDDEIVLFQTPGSVSCFCHLYARQHMPP